MKKIYILFIFLHYISIFSQQKIQSQSDFYFYENKGQIVDQEGKLNPKVKYLFNSGGLNVQIKKEGFSYDVYEVEKTKKKKSKVENSLTVIDRKPKDEFNYKFKFHRVDIDFLDANKNPEIIAEGKSTDYENYYNIPGKPEGITEVHRYQKITYKNIYPKVDLVFFKPNDTTKTIEYNFIVNPGGRISDIKMKFKGAKTKLKDGKLSMNLRFGEMQENIPHSWIEEKTSKTDIAVQFKEIEKGVYGFSSSKDFFDKTVVIDPVPTRIWGSYYGGDSTDYISSITTDKNNNVYFSGNTFSKTNIGTSGAFIINNTAHINLSLDGYVFKADSQGTKIWGTYLDALPVNIHIDRYNNVLSTGNAYLYSTIGTPGTHKPTKILENHDAYILKLDENGTRVWGTFFGGLGVDYIYSSALDGNDNVILVGYTESSSEIASAYAFQKNRNGYTKDGFIAKINTFGWLGWSTYYGGSGDDYIKDIALNEAGDMYLVGETDSSDGIAYSTFFSTPFQSSKNGLKDATISLFSSSGDILFGSYFGGESQDYFDKIDYKNNKFIISGNTVSKTGIATANAPFITPQNINNVIGSAFAIFDFKGNLQLGSYFQNNLTDCAIDKDGNYFLIGYDYTNTLGSQNSYQPYISGDSDAFIVKYDKNNLKKYGTYYGGNSSETEIVFHLDDKEIFYYLGGKTSSSNNITSPNGYQKNKYNQWEDAFVVKFSECTNNVLASSNSPICPNTDIKLQASGGTSYSWTGPNGFTSTDQNPIILNATSVNSGTYSCVISGTGDCDGTYTVEVKVEDKTPPIPDISNLPDITGDCHTIVSTIPTATDNCSGKIIATTNDALQYSIPGTYTITWKYHDGNGNIFTQTQKVIITSPALPTASSPQTFCATNSPKISDITITGQNIVWYDTSGNILNTSDILIDGITYYATQTINGCESDKLPILIKINTTPLPTAKANQDFCTSRNAQIKDLEATGTSLKFYDILGNLLPNTTILQDNTSYFVTQTLNNCESPKFEIKVTLSANSLPANDYNLAFCNDTTSHSKTENLTKYQENIITGSSGYSFEYFDQNNNQFFDFADKNISVGTNIFYVKVKSKDGCWKMVNLTLQLNQKPVVNLPENEEFCRGLSVDLDAGLDTSSNPPVKFKNYKWTKDDSSVSISNDQILKVNTAGKYTVEVTNSSDCKNTSSTVVNQSILADILKVEIFNNNAKVLLSAGGDFEFSLDNTIWQDSNEFKNLSNGNHTVFVRTKLGCIIGQMTFTIFNISNSFTPNGDGINETWKIDGMENYPNSEITVFDRQSTTVLHVITTGSFEWNGYYNGRPLPTATYWYIIKVSDGRIFQGSLLIKNRN